MKPAFLVADKPAGITSHDVVAAVRAVTGIKKVGHTGTLDPFATGVLPLALGQATRLVQFLDESIKVYDGTIAFGAATNTGDPTGETVRTAALPDATEAQVDEVLQSFVGERMQHPHPFSAVKVGGKPLYHYARKGKKVTAEPRRIQIHSMELVAYDHESLRVVITCSRGTYARVLADEIANELDSAGHLMALQRPRSGPFHLEDALDFGTLAGLVAAEPGHTWEKVLMSRGRGEERVPWRPRAEVLDQLSRWTQRPIDVLSHLPLADVRPSDAARVRNGASPPPPPGGTKVGGRYLVVCGDDLVAVAEAAARGPRSLRVFSR